MLRRNMAANAHDDPESPASVSVDREADEPRSVQEQVFRSKVYRAGETDGWIVEPPRNMVSSVGKMVFTGPQAQHLALTYAYEKFGNARFFPY